MKSLDKWFLAILMISGVLIYSDQLLDYYHHPRFLVLSLLTLLYAAALLSSGFQHGRSVLMLPVSGTGMVLTGFTILQAVSILWAPEKSEALFYTQKWFYATALYLLLLNRLSNVSVTQCSWFLARLSRVISLIVLMLITYPLLKIVRTEGWSNESLYGLKVLFGHKSLISSFLFLLLPLNFLSGWKDSLRLPWILLALYQIVVILVLQSRVVYIALALSAIIMMIYFYQNRRQWLSGFSKTYLYLSLLAILTVGTMALLSPNVRQRMNILEYAKSQTATERQDVWRMTLPLIRDNWLIGVGSGNWKTEFPANGVEGSYRMQDQNVFFTRAHNDFLEIQAELGVLGLLLYLSIFFLAFYQLHRMRRKFPGKSRLLLAGILGFFIFSLIDFPKERMELITILVLYLVLIEIMFNQVRTQAVTAWGFLLTIILLMSGNVWTGIMRYQGERNTKLMLEARNEKKWEDVVRFSVLAENRFHHLDPYSVPIQFYRGVAQYEKDDKVLAEEAFEKAHAIAPYNFHILNNLATLALEKKEYDRADIWLNEALRINSRFEDGIYNLSFSKAMQGKYSEALDILSTVPGETDKKEMFKNEILKLEKQHDQAQ